jgi:hypothetical protein
MVLARLNELYPGTRSARIFLTPMEITKEDVEMFLNRGEGFNRFVQRFIKRARRVNLLLAEKKVDPIVYELSVDDADDMRFILRLQVLKGLTDDPPYTSLEVKLPKKGVLTSLTSETEWRVH